MSRRAIDVVVSRSLALKLALVILVVAAIGVTLLSYRQRRLAAAHELAVHHAQAQADERIVLGLRQAIAEKISLGNIRAAANDHRLEPSLTDPPFVESENRFTSAQKGLAQ